MQTATNPETGETVVLVGQQWQKADRIATNDKGEKAYLIGGKWLTEAAPAPTAVDRTKAAIAGANKGIANLLGMPGDTAENLVNLGIAGVGTAATAVGRPDLAPGLVRGTPFSSMWIEKYLNKAGIGTENPRPEDAASRMLHTGGRIAGGSIVPGAGVKSTLAAAAGGAVAGETLGPQWEGVGALAPAAAAQAVSGIKNAIAARTAPNLATFKAAGTTPTVGQATENSFAEGLENLASKFPGGSGVMRRFTEGQQAAIGRQAKTGVSAEDAGRAIEKGIKGDNGFIARTKAEWNQLDAALAAKVPATARFTPSNTVQALDDLTRPTVGAEKTTAAMVNPKIAEWKANLTTDLQANNGQVPFSALRSIRSRVGGMLDDALVSDIPKGELKKLYGALSKDMEAAATQAGAGQEFARQNNYYRARMDRIETVLDRVIGKGRQPEEIFKAFFPSDPDQANKVRATLRSLQPSERQVVSEAVVNRLGRATPGRQNEMGEIFSSETFLTNWNKLSDGAKAQLFPNHAMRQNVEAIAKAAGTIREGSKVFQNTSGTAGSFAAYSVYASPIAAVATGSIAPLVAAGGAAGSAYIGARMMTSPAVVEWLARPVNPSKPGEAVAHLARLATIYNNSKDDALKDELRQFVTSAGQGQAPQGR